MDVILMERIERLGLMGDVVSVKPGYARNYLLPQKKALRATKENMVFFESKRVEFEATNLSRRKEAEAVAAKMEGLTLVLIRQAGETGQLYGSVSARDVAEASTEAGFHIERNQVQMAHQIKTIGIHTERVALHPEVSVEVTLNVAQSEEAAVEQEIRGGSPAQVTKREAEESRAGIVAAAAPAAIEESAEEPAAEGENEGENESENESDGDNAGDEAEESAS